MSRSREKWRLKKRRNEKNVETSPQAKNSPRHDYRFRFFLSASHSLISRRFFTHLTFYDSFNRRLFPPPTGRRCATLQIQIFIIGITFFFL